MSKSSESTRPKRIADSSDPDSSSSSREIRPIALTVPPARARPLIGKPIDFSNKLIGQRFRITEKIGAGGVGTVYAAIDLSTGADVAVKVLHANKFTQENFRRFRREAAAAYQIRHAHLCRADFLGVEEGTPYIVMERLVGETVAARIDHSGPLPVADAVIITLQVLDALSAVHLHGYIHRDVKPGNVLLLDRPGVYAKLIDLGMARTVRRTSTKSVEETITSTGVVPGTPAYLSPEQLSGARDIDERVDVWSAGVVLYEMIRGARLYRSDDYIGLAKQIILGPPPPALSGVQTDVPVELDSVIQKAMAKQRDQRYASASEFRRALVTAWSQHRIGAVARAEVLLGKNKRPS